MTVPNFEHDSIIIVSSFCPYSSVSNDKACFALSASLDVKQSFMAYACAMMAIFFGQWGRARAEIEKHIRRVAESNN